MIVHSLRVELALGIAVPLLACCQADKEVFNPEYFNTEHARCSGRDLVKQGFSGAMNLGTTMEFVGTVESSGIRYSILYYEFINPVNNHGNHRVLVFKDICRYIGSYSVNDRPSEISGAGILFNAPKEYGNVIHFENGMPPKQTWVDGENPKLWK